MRTQGKSVELSKARENASGQVMVGSSFKSDWLRKAPVFWASHRACQSRSKEVLGNFQLR